MWIYTRWAYFATNQLEIRSGQVAFTVRPAGSSLHLGS
jgi:hypothetical protein